jgi:hypothetical protein
MSLEPETAKFDHKFRGTRLWEWLRLRGPAATVNDGTTLSSERMLHKDYESKVSVGAEMSLVVSLKRLDAMTKWRAVNRQ